MDYSRCPDFPEKFAGCYLAEYFWMRRMSWHLMRDLGCHPSRVQASRRKAAQAWQRFLQILEPHPVAFYVDMEREAVVLFPLDEPDWWDVLEA